MIFTRLFFVTVMCYSVSSSAIPIWELLTHQEKIANLTFIFLRLVQLYCKQSDIPDCEKVLTLYGVSNLLKEDENTLDLLDPYQRESRAILWKTVMSGAFTFPQVKREDVFEPLIQPEFEKDVNTISTSEGSSSFPDHYIPDDPISERYPYAVRVPPPPHFQNFRSKQTPSELLNFTPKSNVDSTSSSNFIAQHHSPQLPYEHFHESSSVPSQNSPIISIIPFVRTPEDESYNPSPNVEFKNAFSSRSHFDKELPSHQLSNTLYILPINRRQDPIPLRIFGS